MSKLKTLSTNEKETMEFDANGYVKWARNAVGLSASYLTDNQLIKVMLNVADLIEPNKLQDKSHKPLSVLFKEALRKSDILINILYEEEIYSAEGDPKRIKVDKFFTEFVPQRKETFRQLFRSEQKISMDRMIKAARRIAERQGRFAAIMFGIDHIDLVDTATVNGDNLPNEEVFFYTALKDAIDYDVEHGFILSEEKKITTLGLELGH